MTCRTHIRPLLRLQRGFTIVSAIFILVVLAGLGASIVVVSTNQQIGSALDIDGAHAYQAARSGVDWGLYKIWSSSTASRASATCFADTNLTFPAAATTFSGFVVTVQCTATADPGAHGGPTIFRITATACNQPTSGACPGNAGSLTYVERRVVVNL